MIDRYTKIVLTVIAAALAAIAIQGAMRNASAQLGSGCGSSIDPCYVRTGSGFMDALTVKVRSF